MRIAARTLRGLPALALLLVPVLLLAACKGERATPAASAPPAPPARPEGVVAEVGTDDAAAFLGGLRGQFRDPAAGVPIPENAAEVVERWIALPEQVRRHLPDQARMRVLFLAQGNEMRSAIAVKMRLERDAAHPLGVEIALVAGAPEDARWLIGAPSGNGPVMALRGDVLVAADDRTTLERSLRWLTEVRMPQQLGEGLVVELPAGTLGETLRRLADESLEAAAGDAIAAARAERARHAEAPALGDPEQLVVTLRDRVRRLLAYLPDTGTARLRVVAGAGGVMVDGTAEVAARSPLARALAEARVGNAFGFGALPRATALAIATRRTPGETPWVDVLGPIAGGRLDATDRAALGAAADRLASMRGEASVVAVGAHEDGPFVMVGFESGTTPLDPAALPPVFAVPYVGTALGSLVGCERITIASLASGRTTLCRTQEPPQPELAVARGDAASAVLVSARPAPAASAHRAGAALAAAPSTIAREGLFGDPDAERALASLGDEVILAMAVSSGALIPSLGILGSPGLRRFSAGRPLPTTARPILLAVHRTEGGLGVRMLAPPRALEEAWAVFYLVNALMGGE